MSYREEIDLLFIPDRSVFVFLDDEATKKGRLLHTELSEGENIAFELKQALNRGAAADHEAVGAGNLGVKGIASKHKEIV